MRSWLIAAPVAILLLASSQVPAAEPGVKGSIERLSSSTPQEKLAYAADALDEMRAAERAMERIESASPDCVKQRLPLLRSLIEVSSIAETNMGRWISQGNTVRADSEFRKIAIALTQSRTLQAEAERCSSGESSAVGDEHMEYTYDGVTYGDETQAVEQFLFDVSIDSVPQSSPFM